METQNKCYSSLTWTLLGYIFLVNRKERWELYTSHPYLCTLFLLENAADTPGSCVKAYG